MAITYEPIATTTLGTAEASVTFSTISGAYTDLVLVIEGTFANYWFWQVADILMQFNGDTGNKLFSVLHHCMVMVLLLVSGRDI
jgi:hypothetical protein